MAATHLAQGAYMPTAAPPTTPLDRWPSDTSLALVLDDGDSSVELVLTLDGRAILGQEEYVVTERIPVAERRAGLAALGAGLL